MGICLAKWGGTLEAFWGGGGGSLKAVQMLPDVIKVGYGKSRSLGGGELQLGEGTPKMSGVTPKCQRMTPKGHGMTPKCQ